MNSNNQVCGGSLRWPILTFLFLVVACLLCESQTYGQGRAPEKKNDKANSSQTVSNRQLIDDAIVAAFESIHHGWSSDEVILQNELNDAFLKTCKENLAELNPQLQNEPVPTEADLNWRLMNLRKAGKLKTKTTRTSSTDTTPVRHVAEIVTRSVVDKHQCSIDRLMCDPELRLEFDDAAKAIDDSLDAYSVRKAAFRLRKTRKLRPELITRIADWGRVVSLHSIDEILAEPERLNEHPGVYIFRDASGYLYIGQTENLRKRMQEHLDESHNLSLAKYLKSESRDSISIEIHDFDPKSQAAKTMVRRAYESELIASRKPRFNVQP